jgi:hypothetical protein
MSIFIKNQFMLGEFNNYLIGGNVCNAFVLGELGSQDDFFLVGAEPEEESSYPLLTGNILDSEGNVLFRLVRNVLTVNPGHCSRILGDHVGYEVHDSSGKLILKVRTLFEHLPENGDRMFVTTLAGRFYNKKGELVFWANSGEQDERVEANVKCAFGFTGGFGFVQGMNEEERDFARIALSSRGAIHEPIRGHLDAKELTLDGKVLIDARLTNCKIHLHTGNFALLGQCAFESCRFTFHDEAENVRQLALLIERQSLK